MAKITCFGEILWDVFSTHRKIGGAPLNVALRLQSFGNDVTIVSRVGVDEDGAMLLRYIAENGVNTDGIQVDSKHKTSEVIVHLNKQGSASYNISFPCAWDTISIDQKAKEIIENSDAFVYGSLVARNDISKETLFYYLESAKYKIFDLNLRPPHYEKEVLIDLMDKADFIKCNDDELYEVCGYLNSKYKTIDQNVKFLSEKTNTKHICVTKGSLGAVLLYNDVLYYSSGYSIKVVDTVGAGDSFLGSLISQLLHNKNPQEAINFACAVGAMVAQNEGATPKLSNAEIERFMDPN
tara:strand:+ start:2960 stop:3844 length:885 start_codon:yes stop_codon:yes gene_type:complete